jgi:hypothetical protein
VKCEEAAFAWYQAQSLFINDTGHGYVSDRIVTTSFVLEISQKNASAN